MLAAIRGAGDLATGIALRLYRSGCAVVMTELRNPTAIRRTVCFSQAVIYGSWQVEGVEAVLCQSPEAARNTAQKGKIAVVADETVSAIEAIHPDVVVDAILAKKNLGTTMELAPAVIGVGPGFTAGVDCHAVVETMRGHDLGRVLYSGSAQANTGIPGMIGGYGAERLLRAPAQGIFHPLREIGDSVEAGEIAATVDGVALRCPIGGTLRGILADGTPVYPGMKSGDVDPRGVAEYCTRVSDKAMAVGGGVLEALLHLTGALGGATWNRM